jgi:transposase
LVSFFLHGAKTVTTTCIEKHFGVGLDTARYGHHVSFLDENKRTAAPGFHFAESREGYQKLRHTLERLALKHPGAVLHVRVDAAGPYAENLLQWLRSQTDLPTSISVGQPARNKAYRQAHSGNNKSDPEESLACARFAVVERPQSTPHPPAEFASLRDAVGQMEASASMRTALINQLHSLLARAFPELSVVVHDISKVAILNLLRKYPTAERVAAAHLSSLIEIPHLKRELAEKIHRAAKESTASSRGSHVELLIQVKVQTIQAEMKHHHKLEKLVEEMVESLPAGPHQRVRTIKGIGPQTAAALIAKIYSIDRFASPSALVGYFGVFPELVDVSGTHKDGTPKTGRVLTMSRRGNDHVRRLLYLAAQSAAKHNPAVAKVFHRIRAMGKPYNTAIGHCMAKLLRQVYAVWVKDCNFDPAWETRSDTAPEAAEQEALTVEKENVAGHNEAQEPHRKVVTATHPIVRSKLPPLNFQKLREQLKMAEVLELLHWQPRSRKGAQLRGPCPIHGQESEKDDQFSANIDKHAFQCFRCKRAGNALDFWMQFTNTDEHIAAWDLIIKLHLDPPLL